MLWLWRNRLVSRVRGHRFLETSLDRNSWFLYVSDLPSPHWSGSSKVSCFTDVVDGVSWCRAGALGKVVFMFHSCNHTINIVGDRYSCVKVA